MSYYSLSHAKSSAPRHVCAAWLTSMHGFLRIAVVVGSLLAVATCAERVSANVQTSGNIFPIDNPFDLNPLGDSVDTGLPALGNFLTVSSPPLASELTSAGQFEFEGVHSVFDEPEAVPPVRVITQTNVLVGPSSFGQLLITGNTQLRDETLVIGGAIANDSAVGFTPPPNTTLHGTGFVRITDPGSLYNNDPTILPFGLDYQTFSSRRPANQGFDLYVGRAGAGTLQIDTGGAAEIQDSIVVGDQGSSTGTIIVDGSDSFLGNTGGMAFNGPSDPGLMVVGRQGTGRLNITNGAQVTARAADSAGNVFAVGAMIGGDATTVNNIGKPFGGGEGTVTVDGLASKWTIGGSLQIGGFDSTTFINNPATEDLPGATVQYPGNAGRGTLNINNGAIVHVVAPPAVGNTIGFFLDVLNGLFGQINVNGGSLQIDNAQDEAGQTASITKFRLLNDGNIRGGGSITVGQFHNRSLGQVHVGLGQTLSVTAIGQVFNPVTDENLFSNYGLIDALGTDQARAEIDFFHSPTGVTGGTGPPERLQPFVNFRQATPPTNGGRQVGQILAQSATLRFQSNLENHGFLAFTSGTNVVSGKVINCLAIDPACTVSPAGGAGSVAISGNGTSVTFEDNTFLNNFSLGGINTSVSFKDPPTINGLFKIDSPSANVTVIGDLTLANGADVRVAIGATFNMTNNLIIEPGTITLSPIISGLVSLAPGDLLTILTYGGSILPPDVTFTTIPINLGNGLTLIPLQPKDTPNLILVKVASSAALPINDADLDGNGIVNANDLAVWRSRFGLTGLGDVNGNGVVDAADYTIIRDHFGAAMGAGAGAGAGAGFGAAVPEPGSLALLVTGSMLALALRRRRRVR